MLSGRGPRQTDTPTDSRETGAGPVWLRVALTLWTTTFAAAGLAQTYPERILGIGYLGTHLKRQVHFLTVVRPARDGLSPGEVDRGGGARAVWPSATSLLKARVSSPGDESSSGSLRPAPRSRVWRRAGHRR